MTAWLTRLTLFVVLQATAVVACGGPSSPPGAHKALGTCDQGGYLFLRWPEGLEVLIWHDLTGEAASRSTGFVSGHFFIERGSVHAAGGQSLAWEVQTTDGTSGEAQIGDVRYHLVAGTLFLVTTRGGATEVRQLSRDLSSVPLDHDGIVAFARKDTDLAAFIDEIPPVTPSPPQPDAPCHHAPTLQAFWNDSHVVIARCASLWQPLVCRRRNPQSPNRRLLHRRLQRQDHLRISQWRVSWQLILGGS